MHPPASAVLEDEGAIGRLVAVALVSASPAWAQETVNELPAAPPVLAQGSVTQTFGIAAQPLGAALVRFSEATDSQLFLLRRHWRATQLADMAAPYMTLKLSQLLNFGDYGDMPLKIIWALLDISKAAKR